MKPTPPLFKHQTQTKAKLKVHPEFFDQSEPGTGKTRVEIEDIAERRGKGGKPAIITATRSTLESAWADDFAKYAPDLKVVVAHANNREKAFAEPADAYVTNHDAVNWLAKQDKSFWKKFEGGTLVNDECFPTGTKVDTPKGPTPIEMLKCGDLVYTTAGTLPITRTFHRIAEQLIMVHFDDGTRILCTENHPFATESGWCEARKTRGLRVLRLDLHKLHQQGAVVLRKELQPQSNVGVKNTGRTQRDHLEDSIQATRAPQLEQRGALPRRNKTETERGTQNLRTQAKGSRRQRTGGSMRSNVARDASTVLDQPILSKNKQTAWERLRRSIQTGFRTAIQEMGFGGRWGLAHCAQTLGCEERFFAGFSRVVHISRHECASPCVVHNIQVDGPHNYSVAGKLVHNCTAFKHATSQRSRNIVKIAKHFEFKRNMAGLADPNGVLDLWHQYFILDGGKRLGKSYFQFRSAVCTPLQTGPQANMVKWIEKEGIAPAVAALVKDITIKHLLEECVDMPPNVEYTRPLKLFKPHRKNYDQMQDDMVTVAKGKVLSSVNKAVLRVKLLQIASGAVYNSDEEGYTRFDTDRYEYVIELAEEVPHAVVFFQWKHQKEELVKEAKKRGLSYAVYDGEVSDKERAAITDDFQKGAYRMIFAHPKSAAHGLTWVRGTRTIWASPTDNLEWYKQGLRRIYRIGQTQRTETITVVAEGTYDEIAYERLTGKAIRSDEFTSRLKALIL